ncbi:hypothetical protein [Cetobacterium sp.]|uniref:hypothetical protein n=1 Tax=Cetobacterium sp. TaxID=2071632 RepID=UPI003AF1BC87
MKIEGDISKNDIEKALKDYKISSLERDKDGTYTVTFTTYKVGENEIQLGDKKLKIDVVSTVGPDEKDIYEALSNPNNTYIETDYPHIGILATIAGVIAIITAFFMHLVDRAKDPYIIFKKGMSKVNDSNWKERISLELRRYIDNMYSTNFLGGEYNVIYPLTKEDIEFIKDMDYLKFAPNREGDYSEYKKRAFEIVERLRKEKKNSV